MVDCTKNGSNRGRGTSWRAIVAGVQAMYPEPLPPGEAEAAAQNLVTFCRTLVAIKQRQLREEKKKQQPADARQTHE